MKKFLPKIYQKSVYTINYDKLKDSGVKCLLFDLDNTLISKENKNVSEELIKLFNNLKEKGFRVIIFSNSPSIRIKTIKKILDVEAIGFATKPLKRSFIKVIKKYNYQNYEIALIGDQLLTDVLGGSKIGIVTVLIDPISEKDGIFTIINRKIEKHIYKRIKKNNNFEKGKYYE